MIGKSLPLLAIPGARAPSSGQVEFDFSMNMEITIAAGKFILTPSEARAPAEG